MPDDETVANAGSPDSWESGPPCIPDHELLRYIDSGSYGEVWLARSATRRYRAVKVVYRKTFDHDRPYEREFAGILKFEPISRTHDGFVDVLHVGRNDHAGYFYYVMELGDDKVTAQEINPDTYGPKTLRSEISKQGKLSVDECVQLGLSLTAALAHLHDHGLVHRDIKPSNIIFVDGVPKLADIGLVSSVTEAHSFVGTEGFIPPEGPGTRQSDLYSLGKVLYESCTGKDRMEFPELPTDVTEQPDSEKLLELNAILLKACESDPGRRYRTAHQMHAELELLNRGESVKRKRTRERRLAIFTRVAVAALIMAIVTAFAFVQIRNKVETVRLENESKQERARADLQEAHSLLSQGNALSHEGSWEEAKASYVKAADAFTKLGVSTLAADAGLWQAFDRSPPDINCFSGHTDVVRCAVFSRDGRWVLSGSDDKTVRLWDVATGLELRSFTNHCGSVQSVALSPDGRLALSGSEDKTVRLWGVTTGSELRTFTAHTQEVYAVAFSPDGHYALSGGKDTTVRLWEVATGHQLHTFAGHTDIVYTVRFSPDGRQALSKSVDQTEHLWETGLADEFDSWGTNGTDEGLAMFGLSGGAQWREFRTHSGQSFTVIGDLDQSEMSKSRMQKQNGGNFRVFLGAASPNGRLLLRLSGNNTMRLRLADAQRMWDGVGKIGGYGFRPFNKHQTYVASFVFSPDARSVLSWYGDGTVRLWDVATGRELRSFAPPPSAECAAFSPDGRSVLVGAGDGTLRLWDLATGRELLTFRGHQGVLTCVAFSSDGRRALSGTEDSTLRLWDLATGGELLTLTGHQGAVTCVAFSPDGRRALSGSEDSTLRLWDLGAGRELTAFTGHQGSVLSVAFSRDGRRALSGSEDTTMRLWDVPAGRELRVFTGHQISPDQAAFNRPFSNRPFMVASVAFSRDGRLALSGYADGSVRLWDMVTGRELNAITEHPNPHLPSSMGGGFEVAFSLDTQVVLLWSGGGPMQLWDFSCPATYRGFEERLAKARKSIQENPNDAVALAAFGDWYAFRGLWDWATELLERARNNGAAISSLTLARCYWRINNVDAARREFQRALEHKEAPEFYLQLCLSATAHATNAVPSKATKLISGYHIDSDDVVFDFDPADHEWTTTDQKGSQMTSLSVTNIGKVFVAGEFNGWAKDQWAMEKPAGANHYELRRKLSDFTDQSKFQFKFIINGSYWVMPRTDAANRVPNVYGIYNLTLDLSQYIGKAQPAKGASASKEPTFGHIAVGDEDIYGYRIDKGGVVFEFDPSLFGMEVTRGSEVLVAGEFNHWLHNDKGRITNDYPQWVMQEVDGNRYTLHREIGDFRERSQWQFKFVVDRRRWINVPDSAKNRGELNGIINLLLTIPRSAANASANKN